jgi:hypothetical protein
MAIHWHELASMGLTASERVREVKRACGCGCAGPVQPGRASGAMGRGGAVHWHDLATRGPAAEAPAIGLRPAFWRG